MNHCSRFFAATLIFVLPVLNLCAQRLQQPLGRGVVVAQNGTNATITWRRLASDPENVRFNVYVGGRLLNSTPTTRTCLQTTASAVPAGSKVTVTTVIGTEESAPSVPFEVKTFDMRNIFVDINFEQAGSPLSSASFGTDYVWPIDLDGDGEMDYVVNRKSVSNALDSYVEGYLRTGRHLWTVRLGPNELSCSGQDDMITVCDMDCDGLGDVVIQSSDGTQFWNPEKNTFGLYVNGSTTADTDGDGIIDYETQGTRNAPRYISVIDGMTGREKASVEQSYNQHYNRTNRASLMGDEYNKHVGHMGIFYFDGIHPAVVMEWHMRGSGGNHHYYNLGVAYDFSQGTAGRLRELFNEPTGAPAFHQIRVGDVDGDGCDEMIVGGYTMDHTGKVLFNTGIAHGDRFRTTDIDPERPGLETFAVQQYAGDMLGQVLYDAATGEFIKKWYLAGVGDVGRGECIDIDPNHKGWEMWSTMDGNVYDAQGNLITGYQNQYPCEGIWWDNELDRELVQTSDSHYNVYIQDFFKGREVEFARISGWRYLTVYAKRAAFWGDIIGDWREELILLHKENGVTVGIVGVTTDYLTDAENDNIYCLQEDPHYRGDCSTKGYYQSPNPGFYLGFDMPRPQLPPTMRTDLVYAPSATVWRPNSSGSFTNFERSNTAVYTDGKSVLFDLRSAPTVDLTAAVRPSGVYAMTVKGQTVTISGAGSLEGTMALWKSGQGRFVVNTPLNHTGGTYISEGTLEVNNTIKGNVELRARGTLSGNAVVEGDLVLEGALNYEGGRLMPGADGKAGGSITLKKGLDINRRLFVELDVDGGSGESDVVSVEGNVTMAAEGTLTFTIVPNTEKLAAGRYALVRSTGTIDIDPTKVSVRGISGQSYKIAIEDGVIWLIVNEQRAASTGVRWTGVESSLWDYMTPNFVLDGESTEFVAGDAVSIGDDARVNVIQLDDLMPVSNLEFDNNRLQLTLQGTGGLSGNGGLRKTGNARLNLYCSGSNYTGPTILEGGTVAVKNLSEAGLPGCFGAATAEPENWQMGRVKLIVENNNSATTRGLTLTDTATIQIDAGVLSLKGHIRGNGTLIKAGAGQLNVTYDGANAWRSTILQAGTLAMGTWHSTFGTPNSDITVTGNASIIIFDNNTQSAVPSLANTITVNKNRTLTIVGGQRCSVGGAWLGQGTVKISFPYVRGDVSTDFSKFEGTFNPTSGQLRLTNGIDLSNGTFEVGNGVYAVGVKGGSANEASYTHKIGTLSSSYASAQLSTSVWNVGYLGKNSTFAGIINGNATLNKYGNGTLTLTGASEAAINVYAGAVEANNESAATTTGTVTVKNGATLCGTGITTAVIVEKGGTVGAGRVVDVQPKTLMLRGSLTVQNGGVIHSKARGTKNNVDLITTQGNIVLNSPVLFIERKVGEWKTDQEYKIFDCSGTITLRGTPTFEPEVPADGLLWDYSRLTEGIIMVKADPAVGIAPNAADPTQSTIYDLQGRRLTTPWQLLPSGLYIIDGKTVRK